MGGDSVSSGRFARQGRDYGIWLASTKAAVTGFADGRNVIDVYT